MRRDLTVKSCNDCPLLYDTIRCQHPDAQHAFMDMYDDGFDQGTQVHPLCPLRRAELQLRVTCSICCSLPCRCAEITAKLKHDFAGFIPKECPECNSVVTCIRTCRTQLWPPDPVRFVPK